MTRGFERDERGHRTRMVDSRLEDWRRCGAESVGGVRSPAETLRAMLGDFPPFSPSDRCLPR